MEGTVMNPGLTLDEVKAKVKKEERDKRQAEKEAAKLEREKAAAKAEHARQSRQEFSDKLMGSQFRLREKLLHGGKPDPQSVGEFTVTQALFELKRLHELSESQEFRLHLEASSFGDLADSLAKKVEGEVAKRTKVIRDAEAKAKSGPLQDRLVKLESQRSAGYERQAEIETKIHELEKKVSEVTSNGDDPIEFRRAAAAAKSDLAEHCAWFEDLARLISEAREELAAITRQAGYEARRAIKDAAKVAKEKALADLMEAVKVRLAGILVAERLLNLP